MRTEILFLTVLFITNTPCKFKFFIIVLYKYKVTYAYLFDICLSDHKFLALTVFLNSALSEITLIIKVFLKVFAGLL